jgi:hypothetical protein
MLECRLFRVGDAYVAQNTGVPIGGPLSGQLLETTLGSIERKYDQARWCKQAAKWNLKGDRSKSIACMRYADDVLSLSKVVCSKCLCKWQIDVYRHEVNFCDALDAHVAGAYTSVKFLDFFVVASLRDISIAPVVKNEKAILFDGLDHRKKNRYPVLAGNPYEIQLALRRDLSGRYARLEQLQSSSFDTSYTLILDFGELLQLGYGVNSIDQAWRSLRATSYVFHSGLYAINVLRSFLRGRSRHTSLPIKAIAPCIYEPCHAAATGSADSDKLSSTLAMQATSLEALGPLMVTSAVKAKVAFVTGGEA